jgi:hypothetical protein
VEAGEDPWPPRVEAEALDPVALGLELGQHRPGSSAAAPGPWPRRGAERGRGVGGSGRGGRRERMAMGGEEEGALDLRKRGDLGFGRGGGC